MPAIAAANVTVTVERVDRVAKLRRNRVKVQFGDGSLTYPSGGVPMPGAASFGLRQQTLFLESIDTDDASGIVWKYDKDNNKLRGYIQGATLSAAGAATADDYPLDTTADTLASATSMMFITTTGAGTTYIGKLKELTTTHAPAAQTLYFEAVGK